MAQPQQTFNQWAKTYNSRNHQQSKTPDFFQDGFLWKFVVLAGLSYLVWADKFSLTLSLNDEKITGQSIKASMLTIMDEPTEPTLTLKNKADLPRPKKSDNAQPTHESRSEKSAVAGNPEKNLQMQSYAERFAPVAIAEMHKFGIPASITLAQALLESNAGASGLAKKANNHFGMKCFSQKCGKGHCMNYSDDTHKDFFLKFPNAWRSFRKHSEMLKSNQRYASLFRSKDYRQWANGLAKAGYATDRNYGEKLIRLIETQHLDRYDRQ